MKPSKQLQVEMFRKMLLIRALEEKYSDLYARGEGVGICCLSTGQEAAAVGTCSALKKEDLIVATHRGLGQLIAKGLEVNRMMAELLGRKTGYCKGKGGKMHMAALDHGVLCQTAIVGVGIPIAVGAALSAKMKKTGQVVVSFLGDGAVNMGIFHESLNFASLHQLPIIFACENNCYAMGMPVWKSTSVENIADRAASYSMAGAIVDGNDVLAVYQTAKEAVKLAREQHGPTLIEYKTYRLAGHHHGDPNRGIKYRSKEEMDEWDKKDPIPRFEKELVQTNILTEPEIEQMKKDTDEEIENAVAYARGSAFPELEEALTEVFK